MIGINPQKHEEVKTFFLGSIKKIACARAS
jgi:hypothetical protein